MKRLLSIMTVCFITNAVTAQNWSLTGNTGTSAATNFVGTIDSVNLVFKVFNQRAGLISYNNTSFGVMALNPATTGIDNIALGFKSLYTNTSGNRNVGLGPNTLTLNTTGSSNMAIGFQSLYSNTTGNSNVGVGYGTLTYNTVGHYNTGVGASTLFYNTTGQNNTAIGYWALINNTTGSDNVAIGVTTSRSNTSGTKNVSVGRQASYLNSTGAGLVAIGYMAGYNSLTGTNTAIGYQAGFTSTGGGNVMIGYQAGYAETGSNKLYIANSNTTTPLIYGDFTTGRVGIGTSSPTAQLTTTGTVRFAGLPAISGAPYVLVRDTAGNIGYQNSASSVTSGWASTGNSLPNDSSFIGTLNNTDFKVRTANVERMRIDVNGQIGIGTTMISDTAFKLFVEKGILTRKVKIDALTWADYVFEEDYTLPTLPEVDKFIQQNKHLPGVPSALEVKKNGIDLGDNQAMLLKKIEELTLYIIELDKKLVQQQEQINYLKKN